MTDLFFYLVTELICIPSYISKLINIFLYNVYGFFFILDDIFYKFASSSNTVWVIYEKMFFYINNRSFNYYSQIMWKPSLNISDHIFNVPIFFVLQTMFLVIISVWARAVGPRMRMDQLSQLVWKDFVPSLTLILVVILIIMTF